MQELDTVTIVGCGSVGSYLALNLGLLEKINKLILIDNEDISYKNLPYLSLKEDIVGINKTYILKDFLKDLYNIIEVYPQVYKNDGNLLEGYCIDCRDTMDLDYNFHMKLNMDRNYGRVRLIGGQANKIIQSNMERKDYVYGVNKIFTNLFTAMVIKEFLYEQPSIDNVIQQTREYTINLEKYDGYHNNKFIEIT